MDKEQTTDYGGNSQGELIPSLAMLMALAGELLKRISDAPLAKIYQGLQGRT